MYGIEKERKKWVVKSECHQDTDINSMPNFASPSSVQGRRGNKSPFKSSFKSQSKSLKGSPNGVSHFPVEQITPTKAQLQPLTPVKKNPISKARNAIKKRRNKNKDDFQNFASDKNEVETSIIKESSIIKMKKVNTLVDGRIVSVSKLKPATDTSKQGRTLERTKSFTNTLRRSLSMKRSESKKNMRGSSILSVSSAGSAISKKSLGSRMMTRVKSFKDDRSIGIDSVKSFSSRLSKKLRRKKKPTRNETVMFVKQEYNEEYNEEATEEPDAPPAPRKNELASLLGIDVLCKTFEDATACKSLFCNDEEVTDYGNERSVAGDSISEIQEANVSFQSEEDFYL